MLFEEDGSELLDILRLDSHILYSLWLRLKGFVVSLPSQYSACRIAGNVIHLTIFDLIPGYDFPGRSRPTRVQRPGTLVLLIECRQLFVGWQSLAPVGHGIECRERGPLVGSAAFVNRFGKIH